MSLTVPEIQLGGVYEVLRLRVHDLMRSRVHNVMRGDIQSLEIDCLRSDEITHRFCVHLLPDRSAEHRIYDPFDKLV